LILASPARSKNGFRFFLNKRNIVKTIETTLIITMGMKFWGIVYENSLKTRRCKLEAFNIILL
jgi:hypothetical protein